MKMESLQQRREELERKEYQLKESLLKFDKFLKVIYCTYKSMSSQEEIMIIIYNIVKIIVLRPI